MLTAYGQGWLPEDAGSLANSSGSWVLAAFLVALLGTRLWTSVACGFITLLMLLAGYVVANELRDIATGSSTWLFWGTAAVIVGPLLGLAAYWVRFGRAELAAIGAGAVSGVLIGEGVYGLRYISDTTYPPYWWGQIAAGLILLIVIAGMRFPRPAPVALSVAVAIATSIAFVVLYSHAAGVFGVIS